MCVKGMNVSLETAEKTSLSASVESVNHLSEEDEGNSRSSTGAGQYVRKHNSSDGEPAEKTLKTDEGSKSTISDFGGKDKSGSEEKSQTEHDDTGGSRPRDGLIPGRCQHYLPRKRRFCRSVPPKGQTVCVEHCPDILGRKRITCPLDPKHTCYEDQLDRHLLKCNARKATETVYYKQDLNAGEVEDGDNVKVIFKEVEPEEVQEMVTKVNALYKAHVGELRTEILNDQSVQGEIEKLPTGLSAERQLKQQASLVGHLRKLGLLHDKCCFIEFGAGKAGLSHWVQRGLESSKHSRFVLVDRSSVRYKMDVFHRSEHQGPSFERLQIDIQNLDLNKVPSLIDNKLPVVGLGKHLCGGATDLMLRCLLQTLKSTSISSVENHLYVEGLVVALCCHHRCDWRSFVGKDTFKEWGLGARQFSLMTSMTGWATCATPTFLQKLKEREEAGPNLNHQEQGHSEEPSEKYRHPRYGSLTPKEREQVGFRCKKLIDMARLRYLQRSGFGGELVQYADLNHTLENVALLVRNEMPAHVKSPNERS